VGRVTVVGLGPGDTGLVTAAVLAAIDSVPEGARFLRTAVHPSAHLVAGAETFDHRYESADTFDEVYRAIVADLLAAARRLGHVLYAVPGSPRVLERTVDLLDEAAAAGQVELDVLPAMSFVDLAWVRLGIDPYEQGVRLIDGHRFEVAAAGERGPLLVAHCHNRRVLSDIKLAVDEPPTRPVVLIQRLGLPDEAVTEVEWCDLDRSVEPDHLTSLYIPELAQPVAGEVARFVELVATLRAECPWDAEQTHRTLTRHLLEETYEVLEALGAVGDGGPDASPEAYAHLEEELGDLLFQIVFHTTLATEAGAFGLGDVARGIHDKLVHRHPHVFHDLEVDGADDVVANWEQIKKAEKGRSSIFDGMPADLPALLYALKVTKKAATLGVAPEPPAADAPVGDRLLALVAAARDADPDLDPETALRAAAARLRDRARAIEAQLPFSSPEPGATPPP
jgi:tetrapyrrole methylase family protein / MazG family protein